MAKLSIQGDIQTLAPGVLGANAADQDPILQFTANTNGLRISKLRYYIELTGKTAAEGPFIIGFAANKISSTLLALRIRDANADGELSDSSIGTQIWVRPVMVIAKAETSLKSHDNGKYIDIDVNWTIPEGSELIFWIFNPTGSNATTGMNLTAIVEAYGVWLND